MYPQDGFEHLMISAMGSIPQINPAPSASTLRGYPKIRPAHQRTLAGFGEHPKRSAALSRTIDAARATRGFDWVFYMLPGTLLFPIMVMFPVGSESEGLAG
jgi:hypothetical protein